MNSVADRPRGAHSGVLALLCLLVLWTPAARAETDEGLVQRLVLNSATLRQSFEERAAQDQRVLFEALSVREQELSAALRDVSVARAQRAEMQQQLAAINDERMALVEQLASQSSDFSLERRVLVEQFTGVVTNTSAEKRAALERFAAGDRTVAFQDIEDLTYAENRALAAAASAASAQNLRNLLVLAAQMLLQGEKNFDDIIEIAQQILAYEPGDIETVQSLNAMLVGQYRDADAIALTEAAVASVADDWQRFDLESSVLGSRLVLQPIPQAVSRFDPLLQRVLVGGTDGWSAELRLRFCDAISDRVWGAMALQIEPRYVPEVRHCIDLYGADQRFRMNPFSLLKALGEYYVERRAFDEARSVANFYRMHFERFEFTPGTWVRTWLRVQMFDLQRKVELGEGRYVTADTIPLGTMREAYGTTLRLFGSHSSKAEEQLNYLEASTLIEERRDAEALALLGRLVFQDVGSLPTEFSREIDAWIIRQSGLNEFARLSMEIGDLDSAERGLDRANQISGALQRLHPLADHALLRANHVSVYSQLTASVLHRARLRARQGRYAEAAAQLESTLGALTPHLQADWYRPIFGPFKVEGLMVLGELAARSGDVAGARTRFREAQAAAAEYTTNEPSAFVWVRARFETTLRLAQLDGDMNTIRALRAEYQQLRRDGRSFRDEWPWVRDLNNWRRGRAISWVLE